MMLRYFYYFTLYSKNNVDDQRNHFFSNESLQLNENNIRPTAFNYREYSDILLTTQRVMIIILFKRRPRMLPPFINATKPRSETQTSREQPETTNSGVARRCNYFRLVNERAVELTTLNIDKRNFKRNR